MNSPVNIYCMFWDSLANNITITMVLLPVCLLMQDDAYLSQQQLVKKRLNQVIYSCLVHNISLHFIPQFFLNHQNVLSLAAEDTLFM